MSGPQTGKAENEDEFKTVNQVYTFPTKKLEDFPSNGFSWKMCEYLPVRDWGHILICNPARSV